MKESPPHTRITDSSLITHLKGGTMKKSLLLGAAGIAIAASAIIPSQTFAYRGETSVQGPNYTAERHEAMLKAFENNDYNAWKELMDGRGVTNRITAENFARFATAHKLSFEGKTAEAQQIRNELGLGQHNGSGSGQKQGQGQGMNRNNR